MSDYFGNNCITSILLAMSPHTIHSNNTINTCQFRQRCKLISNKVISNKELTPQQMQGFINKLQKEHILNSDNVKTHNEKDTKILELKKKITQLTENLE